MCLNAHSDRQRLHHVARRPARPAAAPARRRRPRPGDPWRTCARPPPPAAAAASRQATAGRGARRSRPCTVSGTTAPPPSPRMCRISSRKNGLPPASSIASSPEPLRRDGGGQPEHLAVVDRVQRDDRGVARAGAPARARGEQLVTGQHQRDQRHPQVAGGDVLDQVEQPRLGPLRVLDHQQHRRALRQRHQHRAPGVARPQGGGGRLVVVGRLPLGQAGRAQQLP